MPKPIPAAVLLILLPGCSIADDLPMAQTAVSTFHQMLNAGQSSVIYAASGPEMKKASTESDMVQLFDAVHRKLGNFQSGAVTSWNESATTSGGVVTLTYSAKYEHAPVVETFSWTIDQGHAQLRSYFINSTYLIIH